MDTKDQIDQKSCTSNINEPIQNMKIEEKYVTEKQKGGLIKMFSN